jgi:two-component system sensor histidine kinase/response regulator
MALVLDLPTQLIIPPAAPEETVLVVDDTDAMREALCRIIAEAGYHVITAASGEAALAEIDVTLPDLIILDVSMPYLDGYQVCGLLKQSERTRAIPVIFLSALDDVEDKVKAFQMGGVDYITKPADPEEVVARVESQLALSRQRKQIEALSKLKDDLIGIVSHDLKNPLQIIMGYSEILTTDGDSLPEEERLDAYRQIHENSKYMLSIVYDLLDLKKIEDGMPLEISRISLAALLAAEYETFRILAEQKAIRLSLSLPEDDMIVHVDVNRMKQAIRNLVSNAIKYTPNNGDVLISAMIEPDRWIVQVADTGVGIPRKDLASVFKKFYRVPGAQHMDLRGTGLGLSVVQAIIEQHGGTIWVNSVEGRGSTFGFSLPL